MPRAAKRLVIGVATTVVTAWIAVTLWVAFPTESELPLPTPLVEATSDELRTDLASSFDADLALLVTAFRPQQFRSYCGPSSLATVMRAYGNQGVDQLNIFPDWGMRLHAYYRGMTLAELGALAAAAGLRSEALYADTLSLNDFRERLKDNLSRADDYVLVNYSRKVMNQSGDGHISAVAAYDPMRDAFLVLDQAAYRYPFTWVPAPLLYEAAHTLDGDRYRGLLLLFSGQPQ